jgi:hypothetical protein
MVTNSFGNRNFMQPMGSLIMRSKCLDFCFERGGGESLFHLFPNVPFKFSKGSHQVPNMFPTFLMCSSRVFPIAPHFNPICFAQSPPLLTYIGGPKGESLHLSIESSILSTMHSFNLFFCQKVELVRHPQLINMKQTKYPNRQGVVCKGY